MTPHTHVWYPRATVWQCACGARTPRYELDPTDTDLSQKDTR